MLEWLRMGSNQRRGSLLVGGPVMLPAGAEYPCCRLCDAEMPLFFQFNFAKGHAWCGNVLLVFACVSCCESGHQIPDMLTGPLHGAKIPDGFLSSYQTNFRFLVSPQASLIPVPDKAAWIQQGPIDEFFGGPGKKPTWLLDDETPGEYQDHARPCFLLQVREGVHFMRNNEAPPQKVFDLAWSVVDSHHDYYQLFLANQLYFFGYGEPSGDHVYVITQC